MVLFNPSQSPKLLGVCLKYIIVVKIRVELQSSEVNEHLISTLTHIMIIVD